MVNRLDKHSVLDILQTIQRCTAVDRSPPTLMCTLGVANSIFKQYGVEFVAEHVLPLLMPLLSAQQLNVQQFAKYMLFVKDMLHKIEEKRGVAVTDSGMPEVKRAPVVNGLQSEALRTSSSSAVPSSTKSSASWDEDWGPKTKSTASSTENSIDAASPSMAGIPAGQVTSLQKHLSLAALSAQQTTNSCPSVDVEWPPRASPSVTPQFSDTEKQTTGAGTSSTFNLEPDDPFADWPPRPNGSVSGGSGIPINGTSGMPLNIGLNSMTNTSSNIGPQTSLSWSVSSQSSTDSISLNSRTSSTVGSLNSGLGPQNSLGFLKQSQALPASNVSYNNVQSKATDIGSIFSSNKNEHIAPKLAPPPSSAVGRGRGRGRGAVSNTRSSHTKSQTEQPPLLDLLG